MEDDVFSFEREIAEQAEEFYEDDCGFDDTSQGIEIAEGYE